MIARFRIAVAAVAAIAASAVLVPALVVAQAPKAKAAAGDTGDLWETMVKMEMPGMPMAMPATTQQRCLSKQAGDDQMVPRRENCKVTESRRSGNTTHFKMVCTGRDAMNAEGEMTMSGAAYNGRMRMTGKMEGRDVEMTQTFSGRKLGECTGTVPN